MNLTEEQRKRLIDLVKRAQDRNGAVQAAFLSNTAYWHACETIDDHLHDALTILGD